MEQSALEWYEKKIWSLQLKLEKKEISIGIYAVKRVELFEQAKEMEKQQIENAFNKGFSTTQWDKTKENKAEQYYNETFKSE